MVLFFIRFTLRNDSFVSLRRFDIRLTSRLHSEGWRWRSHVEMKDLRNLNNDATKYSE